VGITFELRGPFGRRVVGVAGGRARVGDVDELLKKLAAVDERYGTTSQVFDASRVAGPEHLVHAARLALTAQATKRNFASSLNIELICWVAAERQIARAFEKVGLHVGSEALAVLVIGGTRPQVKKTLAGILHELNLKRDDGVLEFRREKVSQLRRVFSISGDESKIAPTQKLVLERVALLALEK